MNNHPNIIRYYNRPQLKIGDLLDDGSWISGERAVERTIQMNKALIRDANMRVKMEDTVISVGDFACKGGEKGVAGLNVKPIELLCSCNGKWILVEGNHDCFSTDTRLLTLEGYKSYLDLRVGEIIPTMNIDTGVVEYKPIEKVIINPVSKLYGFKTKTAQGKFSENHQMVVRSYVKNQKGIFKHVKVSAKNLWDRKSHFVLPTTCRSGNRDFEILDDSIRLLGWIFTDGGISGDRITIYQSKTKFVKEIKDLFLRMGIEYQLSERTRGTKEICGRKLVRKPLIGFEFHINTEASRRIKDLLSIQSKYDIPVWLPKLSDKQFSILVDEMVKGDGTKSSGGSRVIWGQKEFLSRIMGLCVVHGIDCNLVETKKHDFYLCVHKGSSISGNRYIYPKQRFVSEVNAVTWCVTVENHTLFTELNGKTLISGNCNNGVKADCSFMETTIGKYRVGVQHRPLLETGCEFQGKYRIPDWKIKRELFHAEYCRKMFDFMICGHVHNAWQYKMISGILHINVGVDVNRYMPITDTEVIAIYEKAKKHLG